MVDGKEMSLLDLVKEVEQGRIVLPDFQRNFVWGPEDVRQLLVSVFGGYFIGSLLFLDALYDRNDPNSTPFAIRLAEGVKVVNRDAKIDNIIKIVLDGQQRVTSLFYAFYSPNVPLYNRKKPHRFYIDILKALELYKYETSISNQHSDDIEKPDFSWEDIIYGVSIGNKKVLNKFKNDKYIVPISFFSDIELLTNKFASDKNIELKMLIGLFNRVTQYKIHIVTLDRDTSLDKIVETFERLNKTGMPLSTFDLATARLYKYGIKLRDLLEEAKKSYEFANVVQPENILKVISLMKGKDPRRKNILQLDPENFEEYWRRACVALNDAYTRIVDIKNGYGVINFKKWVPYSPIIVTLAGLIDYLKGHSMEDPNTYAKLDTFYWTSVFSNHYEQSVDSVIYSDYKEMIVWFNQNKVPKFIKEFDINDVDLEVSSAAAAIFKGVISLIVLKGALDFQTGQPPQFELNKNKIQVDHIFPKSIYNVECIDCIPNRTLITTNQSKSNKKPSQFFSDLIKKFGKDKVIEILKSHLISKEGLEYLLNDDFENFMKERKKVILEEIESRIVAGGVTLG